MRRLRHRVPLALAATLVLVLSTAAVTSAGKGGGKGGGLRLVTVAKFDLPTFVGAPRGSGDLAYVTEREGKVRLLAGGRKRGTFLDMRRWVGCCETETGLHSIAFAPNYAKSRRFYAYFTNREDNIEVDEFRSSRKNPRHASPSTRRKIIEVRQRGDVNHNGGQVAFGPDGMLYMATGDGGNVDDPSNQPQKKGSLLGKVLRIDPRPGKGRPYAIPKSNPYAKGPGRGEIYARGLRNPYRFSFDRGRILIGDVGQARREEVDIATIKGLRGDNFGWSIFEGTLRFRKGKLKHHDKPAFQYPHSGGACTIIGGYVVRDPKLKRLNGRYLYGDYCSGEIRSFLPAKHGVHGDRALGVGRRVGMVSFGTDSHHRIYVVEMSSGRVSRLVAR